MNRTQRMKIGSAFIDCTNIAKGISQGSTLSLLLFNICINDLFFFSAKCEICYFCDDNSLYSSCMNLDNISCKSIWIVCIQFNESKS